MNEATLNSFREIAATMAAPKADWTVCRSTDLGGVIVVAFGYTEERARKAATYYKGGFAEPERLTFSRAARLRAARKAEAK